MDNIIKTLWPAFTKSPINFKCPTSKQEMLIFDLPTIFFLKWPKAISTPIYWDFEKYKELSKKIIKDVWWKRIDFNKLSSEDVFEFRKYFYQHPELIQEIKIAWYSDDEFVTAYNDFLKATTGFKIFSDLDIRALNGLRMFFATGNKNVTNLWSDTHNNIFSFLKFDRFDSTNETLNAMMQNVIQSIIDNNIDVLSFKNYWDWDKLPDFILDSIEQLILYNYSYDPKAKKAAATINLNSLKENIWFKPKWWQRYMLVYESRENLEACSRRAWKSMLSVYLAIRQLMLPNQMILYILPTKEWFSEQPFFYVQEFFTSIKNKHWIEDKLPWFNVNSKDFKVTYTRNNSKILFISARGSTGGSRSFSANLVIIDEAWYVPDAKVYDTSYASTTDTKGRMFAISTINIDTPINWFFYKKIELDGADDSLVCTVDIYYTFLPIEEIKRIEKKYKNKNESVWLAEYMCIFVWQDKEFNVGKFFNISFDYSVMTFNWLSFNFFNNLNRYKRFWIWYDAARNKDRAWVAVIWLTKNNKIEVICTGYIDVRDYIVQTEVIRAMYDYLKQTAKSDMVIDTGKAGIALYDYLSGKWYSPYWIYATSWMDVTKRTYREWSIPKNSMETWLQFAMSHGIITWYSFLENIKNEFETYSLANERKGTDHHNDIVSALMNVVSVWYHLKVFNFEERDYSVIDTENWPVLLDEMLGIYDESKVDNSINRMQKFIR